MTRGRAAEASLERFDIGGATQWALVRGRSRHKPVLLLVQGGPGLPMIHDARSLERALHLEDHFRVVYWDQRGAGRSFDPQEQKAVGVDDLVGDVRALVAALCDRLGVDRVDVVGFSLGGSLSLIAAATEPGHIRSVTAVGPDTDLGAAERFAYDFALAEAERRGHRRACHALRAIGPPPHTDARRFIERVKWVTTFGGICRHSSYGGLVRAFVLRLLTSPHYSMREVVGTIRGVRATPERVLGSLRGFDLAARAARVDVPVALFQGRHDAAAPPHLTERYYEQLDAPRGKRLAWFGDSAHMPHLDEPARFREALLEATRPHGDRGEG